MSAKKPAPFHAVGAGFRDWKARHNQAMQNPRTLFEQAFAQMLGGWHCYATAHQAAYESHILKDGVLGECWSAIGEGLLGLLNGELGGLDGGTLDGAIRNLLEPEEENEDTSEIDAAPEEGEEETDVKESFSLRKGESR